MGEADGAGDRARLQNAPKGNLRIAKKEKGMEYYYVAEGEENKNGRYIKKKHIDLAKTIAQRDYDTIILQKATKRLKVIENFLKEYAKTNLQEVFRKTNSYRRELINSGIISDDEFIKCWQEEKLAIEILRFFALYWKQLFGVNVTETYCIGKVNKCILPYPECILPSRVL